ncbi:MAG TPA: hypothetical protein VJH03_23045 [Blastocatellia bacterium]|nr:hypothetical protein [Blastocatellia bacterium]
MRTLASIVFVFILASSFGEVRTAVRTPTFQREEPAKKAQSKPDTAEAAKDRRAEPEDRAKEQFHMRLVVMLRSIGDESKKWNDPMAAASLQAQVADLTWEADPGIALGYLMQAWETTGLIREENREGASPEVVALRSRLTASRQIASRREVLLIARKRRPDVATRWLDELAKDAQSESKATRSGVLDDRTAHSALLLAMAADLVDGEPKVAVELAIESLRDGISFRLQNVLIRLQQKDFNLAQQVLRAAFFRLRTVGLLDPDELMILFAYLYTPGVVPSANLTGDRGHIRAVTPNEKDITPAGDLKPELSMEFLRLVADILLHAPLPSTTADPLIAARSQTGVITFLMPRMQKELPDLAETLRQRMAQLEVDARFVSTPDHIPVSARTSDSREPNEDYDEQGVEELAQRAEKESSPAQRDRLYAQAALSTAERDYERGFSLAKKIDDKLLQAGIVNWIAYRAALHIISANKIDLAYEIIQKNEDHAQRATCLVVGGQWLLKAKDRIRASQWLQEARSNVAKAEPDESLTRITLGVAAVYAQFDAVAGLEVLTDAIKLFNRFPLAPGERVPRPKRVPGFNLPDFSDGPSGFGLNAVIAAFDQGQFEDVAGRLNQIAKPEVRGAALLRLCRKHLPNATAATR